MLSDRLPAGCNAVWCIAPGMVHKCMLYFADTVQDETLIMLPFAIFAMLLPAGAMQCRLMQWQTSELWWSARR